MFDLQLDKIAEGVLICIIKPDGSTRGVFRVGTYAEQSGKYRYQSITTDQVVGLIPMDGLGYYAMQARDKPHFFYSANPEHVQKAQKAIKAAQKKQQKKEQADKAKLKELQGKIDELLKEYGASLDVSLYGDTHGVESEMYLSIGQYGVKMD